MEHSDEKPESINYIVSLAEAEIYTGALWRKPTPEELEELATFFANEEIDGEIRVFGEEFDTVEKLIAVDKRTLEIMEELQSLTMVQDLVKLNVQVFYTYFFLISATETTHTLSFEDGMCKMIKKDGELKSYLPGDIMFDL